MSEAPQAAYQDLVAWVLSACRELGLRVSTEQDDIFAAGGTSLTAIKLIAKVEERYGEDALPPDDLFTEGSVRAIAESIGRNAGRATGEA